jgi:hypothetical protein
MSPREQSVVGWHCLPLRRGAGRFLSLDGGRAEGMLHTASNEVRKHSYDPKLHGLAFTAERQ